MGENTNLDLWNSVEKTNPEFTKQVNFGRKYTAIDAQYQIKNATEVFGSYGEWGLKNLRYESFDIPSINGNPPNVMVKLQATFYYPKDKKVIEFDITNSSLMFSQKGKVDEDIYKKIETNTVTKALSKLGFNADIFMGMYEDSAYVNELASTMILISVEQRQIITQLIQNSDTDLIKFNTSFNISKLTDLPQSEFNKAVALLNSKINKQKKAKQDKES